MFQKGENLLKCVLLHVMRHLTFQDFKCPAAYPCGSQMLCHVRLTTHRAAHTLRRLVSSHLPA